MFFTKEHRKEAQAKLIEIFNELKKKNNNLVLLYYSSTYYVYEHDILYFESSKIKEDRWRMAMWARYDDDYNVIGAEYIAEPEEFVDKFKPDYTSIDTNNPDKFLKQIAEVEEDSKEAIIKHIFNGDRIEYQEYYAAKNREKELNEIYFDFLQKTIPEISKTSPHVRGVSIRDNDFRKSMWTIRPRYDARFWVKQCEDVTQYYDELDAIIDKYNKQLKELSEEKEDSHIYWEYEISYSYYVSVNAEVMAKDSQWIYPFEPLNKKQKHLRRNMMTKAAKMMYKGSIWKGF